MCHNPFLLTHTHCTMRVERDKKVFLPPVCFAHDEVTMILSIHEHKCVNSSEFSGNISSYYMHNNNHLVHSCVCVCVCEAIKMNTFMLLGYADCSFSLILICRTLSGVSLIGAISSCLNRIVCVCESPNKHPHKHTHTHLGIEIRSLVIGMPQSDRY
jgi:hypothetical protein